VVYVLYAGLVGRSDPRAALAGAVTDLYLPASFAHNFPAIHVPLIAAAVFLHARNARHRRFQTPRP